MAPVSTLADAVLPLIRTRSDLYRYSAANAHGRDMHEAVDILEAAIPTTDPAEIYAVTHKALASSLKVIARADDSSGIIGDACRRLLELHPQAAAAARTPVGKLIDWMMKFQFDEEVDYFELDPVAYAPALGEVGMAAYRKRLAEVETRLGPQALRGGPLDVGSLARVVHPGLERAAAGRPRSRHRRDHPHPRQGPQGRGVAGGHRRGVRGDRRDRPRHRLGEAGHRLRPRTPVAQGCGLLVPAPRGTPASRSARGAAARVPASGRRRPRRPVCTRRPGRSWPDYRDEVVATLAASPSDAVLFALLTLKEPEFAWNLAHSLALDSDHTWSELVKAYEKVDPLAVLPIHQRLVENELVEAGAQHYRLAARRLAKMRKLANGSDQAVEVDELIAELRKTHRRRPRLQQEFDRAGLPRAEPR